jgi:hypothetical protein
MSCFHRRGDIAFVLVGDIYPPSENKKIINPDNTTG